MATYRSGRAVRRLDRLKSGRRDHRFLMPVCNYPGLRSQSFTSQKRVRGEHHSSAGLTCYLHFTQNEQADKGGAEDAWQSVSLACAQCYLGKFRDRSATSEMGDTASQSERRTSYVNGGNGHVKCQASIKVSRIAPRLVRSCSRRI